MKSPFISMHVAIRFLSEWNPPPNIDFERFANYSSNTVNTSSFQLNRLPAKNVLRFKS